MQDENTALVAVPASAAPVEQRKVRTPDTSFDYWQVSQLQDATDQRHLAVFGNDVPARLRGKPYLPIGNAILEANFIFGFGGWSVEVPHETIRVLGVSQHNGKFIAHAEATAIVHVGGCKRTGYGYGKNQPQPNELEAVCMAKATAESMAIKAALKTFGHRFGIGLADENDPLGQRYTNGRYGVVEEERIPAFPGASPSPAAQSRLQSPAPAGAIPEGARNRLFRLVNQYRSSAQGAYPQCVIQRFDRAEEFWGLSDNDPAIPALLAAVEQEDAQLMNQTPMGGQR